MQEKQNVIGVKQIAENSELIWYAVYYNGKLGRILKVVKEDYLNFI